MQNNQQKILEALKINAYVSGETLAEQLSISRTAVWKHIKQLQQQGYDITAKPRKGYILNHIPDLPLEQEIRGGLETSIIGKRIQFFSKVPSTNDVLKKLAKQGESEGTIIIAEEQTNARGRKNRYWNSPKEGLWFSILLRPHIPPQKAMLVTMIASIALTQAIHRTIGLKPMIKWPNDLLIQDKKVCGILTELSAEMDQIEYMIIGIGLNVNNTIPESLQSISVSLKQSTHRHISRVMLMQAICIVFDEWYEQLKKGHEERIRSTWLSLSQIEGKTVEIKKERNTIKGIVKGIDPQGGLIVESDQSIQHILTGDIHYIKDTS